MSGWWLPQTLLLRLCLLLWLLGWLLWRLPGQLSLPFVYLMVPQLCLMAG